MLFDKSTVIESVKLGLSSADRKKKKRIDVALASAVDDLLMRISSDTFMTTWSTTLPADSRELTLTGDADDLLRVFLIKLGSGEEQIVMQSKDKRDFLTNHDSATISDGKPSMFSVVSAEDGFPVVRFDRTADADYSLLIYYTKEVTPSTIGDFRFISPIVDGTLAYFYGVASTIGQRFYGNFEKKVALMKMADEYDKGKPSQFGGYDFVDDVMKVQRTISRRRH